MATISQTLRLQDKVSPVFKDIKKNAESVITSYEHLSKAQDRIYKQMEDMEKRGLDSHSKLYKRLAKDYGSLDEQLKTLSKTGKSDYANSLSIATQLQDRLTNSVKGSSVAMNAFHSIARKVIAVFGVKSLMNMSDAMTQTEARLGIALSSNNWTGSAAGFSNAIFAAAQRSRSDYNTLAGTVSKLGMQAGGAFAGPNELIKFAENLNKVFITSGLDSAGIQSVMYNLTQSMSTGHLLGNDYRILKMNAPELVNMLKNTYANGDQATLDQMVSKGQVTSQMLKSTIINNTEDIEKKFKEMPVTWEQVWIRIKNTTQRLLKPILKIVSNLAKAFDDGLTWIENHWEQLQPLIIGGLAIIISMFGLLLTKKIANNIATLINTVSTYAETKAFLASAAAAELKATAEGRATLATLQQAFATQTASLAMLKYIAILALVVTAVVAVAYACSWVFEKVTGETMSALGLIIGSIFVIFGTLYNVLVGFIDAAIALINHIIEPIVNVIEFITNAWNGGFDNIGDAAANLIGNMISWFLGLGKVVTTIIDAIFGTNWTSGLESLQTSVRNWGKNENAVTYNRNIINNPLKRANIYDQENGLFYKGYNMGKGWQDSLGNAFKGTNDLLDSVLTTDGNGNAALNTNVGGSVSLDREDIQLLLDIATRDFNIDYQQITPEITLTFTGDIGQPSDVDGVIENIYNQLREEYNGDLEVVMG